MPVKLRSHCIHIVEKNRSEPNDRRLNVLFVQQLLACLQISLLFCHRADSSK